MRHEKGFTLIELMIVIAIILILGSILVSFFTGVRSRSEPRNDQPNDRMGGRPRVDGASECVQGYSFIRGDDGSLTQVIGKDGAGVSCEPAQ
jgi:prepilin-type N-terminal cleavage/methylation domain-containing protein